MGHRNCGRKHPKKKVKRFNGPPQLIECWEDLAKCESETHTIEIEGGCSGWIRSKHDYGPNDSAYYGHNHYLSTHTFYGSNYKYSTKLLQKCGFNVKLVNWDAEE